MRHGNRILTTESSAVLNILTGGDVGFAASVFAESLRRWMYRPQLQLEFSNGREHQARTTLTIRVSGEVVKPAFIKIVFSWAGVWDKYEAHTS
jgi:hypothetical protein